ncbi:MAG: pyridoxamine 5'-phosphate oxidase [SAR116 cluster bacterium]|jgi:pyridoxamine 5'-phosphate oxidase|nr:pyridoxamine 5'-phosphate oxidase [SAR116 cluster bacterium]|tara:strand:- start:854 stop:1447 length:594 start_codon:yes stop_codon:yes gene_type:complete
MELDKLLDPIQLFETWFDEAKKKELRDPNAMQLATVSKDGMPSVRTVLLKDIIDGSFVFYTNYESRKSDEIFQTGKGAICFYWKSLNRQVRMVGQITKVDKEISDLYFSKRSKGSRVGAWASMQSRPLDSRKTLINRVKDFENKFDNDIPRPDHWGGFALSPIEFEFWQDGEFRLHDRFILKPSKKLKLWEANRYYP